MMSMTTFSSLQSPWREASWASKDHASPKRKCPSRIPLMIQICPSNNNKACKALTPQRKRPSTRTPYSSWRPPTRRRAVSWFTEMRTTSEAGWERALCWWHRRPRTAREWWTIARLWISQISIWSKKTTIRGWMQLKPHRRCSESPKPILSSRRTWTTGNSIRGIGSFPIARGMRGMSFNTNMRSIWCKIWRDPRTGLPLIPLC